MGLFGFIGDVASSTVKIAATPIAAAADVVGVAIGNEATATKNLIKSAGEDMKDSFDELTGEI